MEDVTDIMAVAKRLADHTNEFESKLMDRTKILESKIEILMKEVGGLKKG